MSKYANESARIALARTLAQESIVLLKNDGTLPLAGGSTVALLGRTQNAAVIGGGGSGASSSEHVLQAVSELEAAGLTLVPELKNYYAAELERELAEAAANRPDFAKLGFEGLVASGILYEIFGKYNAPVAEPMPNDDVWSAAAPQTDTAVCIIGRSAGGEECDRRVEDDYYLLESELALVERAAACFEKVVVVLNVNGPVDVSRIDKIPQVRALVFAGAFGEQGMGALADILTGRVSPSGKLAFTLAGSYADYPTARDFSFNKDDPDGILTYESYGLDAAANGSVGFDRSPVTVYREDIYLGYRYFDSFGVPTAYPFGHGLGYAEFAVECVGAEIADGKLTVSASVKNLSEQFGGKETVQLYLHAPQGRLEQPYQQLKAVAKTALLAAGESDTVSLSVKLEDFASFDESRCAYVIEAGEYALLLGTSSAATKHIASVTVAEEIVVRQLSADIGLTDANRGKIDLLTQPNPRNIEKCGGAAALTLSASDLAYTAPTRREYDFSVPAEVSTLADVASGKVTMEAFINQMSAEELAVLCNGYGPGLPWGGIGQNAPHTIQYPDGSDIAYNSHPSAFPGYLSPALEKYGIFSACYKDGPASVGKTAWPTGMALACTFNAGLLYEFGSACGLEAELQDVDSWLAPGMNMMRNPIGGRNFEYFSEDPFVTALCAVQIAKGAMEQNAVTVCPKHFALNEQETYRRGSERKRIDAADSIVSARAARELYLKPFEAVITEAKPRTIMTSFNKINGTFAAGNRVLCDEILRGEWGFDGVVVTDWGDMDTVVDGADAVAAGNDVIMPGGPPVIAQVLKGLDEGRVSLDEMKLAVAHLLNFVIASKSFWRVGSAGAVAHEIQP